MPGMDGPQLAKRLGAVKSGLKVLFMSGYTADVMSSAACRNMSCISSRNLHARTILRARCVRCWRGTRQLEHPMPRQSAWMSRTPSTTCWCEGSSGAPSSGMTPTARASSRASSRSPRPVPSPSKPGLSPEPREPPGPDGSGRSRAACAPSSRDTPRPSIAGTTGGQSVGGGRLSGLAGCAAR